MDNKKLWESTLVEIEIAVSKATFNTWFKNTSILKQEDGGVVVSVPNAFVRQWLMDKYHKTILKTLRNLAGDVRSVEYVVIKDEPRGTPVAVATPPPTGELPLADLYVDRESNLNPRYTFDTFVVGPFNELVHAAAQAVLKNLGTTYNPLFVYGNTGHGKTHLLQAVGNHGKNVQGKKVYYMSSEKFALEYINAVQTNRVVNFKERYRRYEVFIMDDIQFLSSKEKTQEELFHLFNSLYEENKQIVFSSDTHPNFIPNLGERLKSRFAAGMVVDIPAPDQDSRVAILRAKVKLRNFSLENDVVEYVASTVEGNIRDLEGILNTVVCHTQLKNRPLSLLEVKNLVRNAEKPKRAVSAKEVVRAIANFYNITEANIYEKTRRKEVVLPRQVAMYILREDCNVSYPLIGQKLGGRDHTTVIHSYEKIKRELKVNSVLEQELKQIRAMI